MLQFDEPPVTMLLLLLLLPHAATLLLQRPLAATISRWCVNCKMQQHDCLRRTSASLDDSLANRCNTSARSYSDEMWSNVENCCRTTQCRA
jgi:hypothetical protein